MAKLETGKNKYTMTIFETTKERDIQKNVLNNVTLKIYLRGNVDYTFEVDKNAAMRALSQLLEEEFIYVNSGPKNVVYIRSKSVMAFEVIES